MKKLTITCALGLAALAAAQTAAATPPTTAQTSLHRSFPNYLSCPGFAVHGEFDLDRTTTTFYDTAGDATRTVSHIHAEGTLSNPLTGKSIADSGDFKLTIDLTTGERTMEGKVSKATSPGQGVVYEAVGRFAIEADGTVFEAGPHDDVDNNYGDLCSYLAAP